MVVYQNSKTQSIRGELIKQYAKESVYPYVEGAIAAAKSASVSAEQSRANAESAALSAETASAHDIQGGTIITVAEFITGCIVNLWLGWDVWDYSEICFNVLGQICLQYWMLWVVLAGPVIVMFDLLAFLSGRGPWPKYYLM